MQFEDRFDFDCNPDAVMAVLTDAACHVDKYRHLRGPQPHVLDSGMDNGRFVITLLHTLSAEQLSLPDFVRKRIGQQITLKQTEIWHAHSATGRIDIDMQAAPVHVGIDARMIEHEGVARLVTAFDLRANVPLVGGKIERALMTPVRRRMRSDLEQTARLAQA